MCRLHDRLAAYQSDDTDQSAWADVEQLCIQVCTLQIRQLKNNLSHCTDLFHNGVGAEPLVGHKPIDDCSTLLVSSTVRFVHLSTRRSGFFFFFCLPACLCMSVCLLVSGCLSVCLCVCPSVCLSVCLSVSLFACLSLWLSLWLCLSACLSACLSFLFV